MPDLGCRSSNQLTSDIGDRASKRAGDLFSGVGLDDVADFDFAPFAPDPALEPLKHLPDIVFKALERAELRLTDHAVSATDAELGASSDLPLQDIRAGNGPHLADWEERAHLGLA